MGSTGISPQLLMQALGTDPNQIDPNMVQQYLDHIKEQGKQTFAPSNPANTPQGQPLDSSPRTIPANVATPLATDSAGNTGLETTPQKLQKLLYNPPQITDPALKPSIGRRIGGGLIGFGIGLKNPEEGAKIGGAFTEDKFGKAYQNWQNQTGALEKQQGVEQSQEKTQTAQNLADTKEQAVENQLSIAQSKVDELYDAVKTKSSTAEDIAKMKEDDRQQYDNMKAQQAKDANDLKVELEQMKSSTTSALQQQRLDSMQDRLDEVLQNKTDLAKQKTQNPRTLQQIQDQAEQDSLRDMASDPDYKDMITYDKGTKKLTFVSPDVISSKVYNPLTWGNKSSQDAISSIAAAKEEAKHRIAMKVQQYQQEAQQ